MHKIFLPQIFSRTLHFSHLQREQPLFCTAQLDEGFSFLEAPTLPPAVGGPPPPPLGLCLALFMGPLGSPGQPLLSQLIQALCFLMDALEVLFVLGG